MGGVNLRDEIGGLVSKWEHSNPDLTRSARVKAAWMQVVDPQTAQHVTAVYVVPNSDAGKVVVYVDSPIWTADLNMQAEMLRLKLNVELNRRYGEKLRAAGNAEPVKSLRFVTSKERYVGKAQRLDTADELSAQEEELAQVEPVALSADELAQIEGAAEKVEDSRLRDAALAAAKASLEWQKGLSEHEREKEAGKPTGNSRKA